MHSMYPLLLLLWSLLSSCAAADPLPSREKGLRRSNDIYTVVAYGDKYAVYSPDYASKLRPITILEFPTYPGETDQVIVHVAYNAREEPHRDGSPTLHLSDVIQAVASRHARKSLSSINWLMAKTIINEATLGVIQSYSDDWRRRNPGAQYPERLTIRPSDPFWQSFQNTPFFKAATYAFSGSRKSVGYIELDLHRGIASDLWFHMSH
ncbi:hypothetical protein LX36DRAFT_390001 [Colletotrichum falcatum]|nr:hypothetical protein LX36DRAFT_390001 [Colletotrichum falcatum]